MRRDTEGPTVDPYGPDRPDYAARTRETVTELPSGLVLVSIGDPEGACEAPEPAKEAPKKNLGAPFDLSNRSATYLLERADDWRRSCGLNKQARKTST